MRKLTFVLVCLFSGATASQACQPVCRQVVRKVAVVENVVAVQTAIIAQVIAVPAYAAGAVYAQPAPVQAAPVVQQQAAPVPLEQGADLRALLAEVAALRKEVAAMRAGPAPLPAPREEATAPATAAPHVQVITAKCAACHGENAGKDVKGFSLMKAGRPVEWDELTPAQQVKVLRRTYSGDPKYQMPPPGNDKKIDKLTDEEVAIFQEWGDRANGKPAAVQPAQKSVQGDAGPAVPPKPAPLQQPAKQPTPTMPPAKP